MLGLPGGKLLPDCQSTSHAKHRAVEIVQSFRESERSYPLRPSARLNGTLRSERSKRGTELNETFNLRRRLQARTYVAFFRASAGRCRVSDRSSPCVRR